MPSIFTPTPSEIERKDPDLAESRLLTDARRAEGAGAGTTTGGRSAGDRASCCTAQGLLFSVLSPGT